jgi:hypothetical protein
VSGVIAERSGRKNSDLDIGALQRYIVKMKGIDLLPTGPNAI